MVFKPNWQPAPRGYCERNPRILIPRPGLPVDGVVLSDVVEGVEVHWHGGRTVPCTQGEGNDCPLCKDGLATRWKGYVCLWDPDLDRKSLAEITDEPWFLFVKKHPDPPALRGYHLRLERLGGNARGRVKLILTPYTRYDDSKGHFRIDPKSLPKSLDVRGALMRIWRSRTPGAQELPPEGL